MEHSDFINIDDRKKQRTANSTYKKLAVQRLNEVLCFISSSLLADSFRLPNRQLLVAAKRYASCYDDQQQLTNRQKYANI